MNQSSSSPIDQASLFSKLTFSWIFPLVWSYFRKNKDRNNNPEEPSFRKKLTLETHQICPKSMHSTSLAKKLQSSLIKTRNWAHVLILFARYILLAILLISIFEIILLRWENNLLHLFKANNSNNKALLGVMIIFLKLLHNFSHHHCYFLISTLALKMKSATISLGFQRILYNKNGKVENASSINRLIVDSGRLYALILVCNLFWTNPTTIFSFITLFYSIINTNYSDSDLAKRLCTQIFIFILSVVGISAISMFVIQNYLKPKAIYLADVRIQRTSEVLRHLIDYINPNSLYPLYLRIINDVRRRELKKIFLLNFVFAIISAFSWWAPSLAMHFILRKLSLNYLSKGAGKDDQNLLTTMLSYFSQLVGPLWIFPLLINKLVSCRVAVRRLCKLLVDVSPLNVNYNTNSLLTESNNDVIQIQVDSLRPILLDGSFSKGQLIGIKGEMGSGKTALLDSLALLPSSPFSSRIKHCGRGWNYKDDSDGDSDSDGDGDGDSNGDHSNGFHEPNPSLIGHCPPNGTLKIGSIRDNVVFDRKFDPIWYEEVLRVCALTPSLFEENISSDSRDVMSVKKLLCSGGQRERILLGRALYGRPRILLIDDNLLTSLDERIANYIFNNLIQPNSFLSSLTIVLVSNNKKYLSSCAVIWMLEKVDSNFLIQEIENPLHDNESINDDLQNIPTSEPFSQEQGSGGGSGGLSDDINTKTEPIMNVFSLSHRLIKESGGIFIYLLAFALLFVCDLINLEREKNLLSFFPLKSGGGVDTTIEHFSKQLSLHSTMIGCQALLTIIANTIVVYICYCLSHSMHSKFIATLPILIGKGIIGADDCISKIGRDLEMIDYNYFEKLITLFGICSRIFCLSVKFVLENKFKTVIGGAGGGNDDDDTSFSSSIFIISLFISLLVGISITFILLQCSFSPLWRALIRIQSRLISPLTSMLLEYSPSKSLLQSSRLYGTLSIVKKKFSSHLDRYITTYFLSASARRWLLFRVDLISITFYAVSLILIMMSPSMDRPTKGIFISWISFTPGLINRLFKQLSEIDHIFIAMERLSLDDTTTTTATTTATMKDINDVAISFKNVTISNGENSKSSSSINLSFDFSLLKGENLCLMGRTGAGKSTIIHSIFDSSKIIGDGIIDVSSCPVALLQMDQLPSLPFVLGVLEEECHTIRDIFSLNYYSLYQPSDQMIYECFSVVFGCSESKIKLDTLYKEYFGSTLSSGQMQLILVGRALIDCLQRGSSLLLMDEATCSLSLEDDVSLHSRLLPFLKNHSIALLTVTHRSEVSLMFERKLFIKGGELVNIV